VVIDGLSKQTFLDLGVQVAPFTGSFANRHGQGADIHGAAVGSTPWRGRSTAPTASEMDARVNELAAT
jgi:hypothetical protein